MEDTYAAIPVTDSNPRLGFYAVFDGHGKQGKLAAAIAAEVMKRSMEKRLAGLRCRLKKHASSSSLCASSSNPSPPHSPASAPLRTRRSTGPSVTTVSIDAVSIDAVPPMSPVSPVSSKSRTMPLPSPAAYAAGLCVMSPVVVVRSRPASPALSVSPLLSTPSHGIPLFTPAKSPRAHPPILPRQASQPRTVQGRRRFDFALSDALSDRPRTTRPMTTRGFDFSMEHIPAREHNRASSVVFSQSTYLRQKQQPVGELFLVRQPMMLDDAEEKGIRSIEDSVPEATEQEEEGTVERITMTRRQERAQSAGIAGMSIPQGNSDDTGWTAPLSPMSVSWPKVDGKTSVSLVSLATPLSKSCFDLASPPNSERTLRSERSFSRSSPARSRTGSPARSRTSTRSRTSIGSRNGSTSTMQTPWSGGQQQRKDRIRSLSSNDGVAHVVPTGLRSRRATKITHSLSVDTSTSPNGLRLCTEVDEAFETGLQETLPTWLRQECEEVRQMLVTSFDKAHKECLELVEHGGTTGCCAVVMDDAVIVGNVGDCRCVMSRSGVAIELSSDHRPDRADEKARIEAKGGQVIFWGSWRVEGVLNLSRSLGDRKWTHLVGAEPELTTTEICDDDEFLILASDGVWGVLSSQQAVDEVHWYTTHGFQAEAADRLVQLALSKGSNDNCVVCLVCLPGLSRRRAKSIS